MKVCKEYAERHLYLDKMTFQIKQMYTQLLEFDQFKEKLLFPWQFKVLAAVMNQRSREIMWVVDSTGSNGKSFLARYMKVLYGSQYLGSIR